MTTIWEFLVRIVDVLSALVFVLGGGVTYIKQARRRLWWPFNPRLPPPLKLELKRLLSGAKRFNPITRVEVVLSELDGDHVWVKIAYYQSMSNLSRESVPLHCRFTSNGRRHRRVVARLDDELVMPFADTESEIMVVSQLKPKQTRVLELHYEMAYNRIDSELFVSYRAGGRYDLSVVDAISGRTGSQQFVLEIEPLFSPDQIQNLVVAPVMGHAYSRQFSVVGGFSPFSGVYLKWRQSDHPTS